MDRKWKMNALLIAFGVILYAVVMNFNSVLIFAENIIGIFSPVLIGLQKALGNRAWIDL